MPQALCAVREDTSKQAIGVAVDDTSQVVVWTADGLILPWNTYGEPETVQSYRASMNRNAPFSNQDSDGLSMNNLVHRKVEIVSWF